MNSNHSVCHIFFGCIICLLVSTTSYAQQIKAPVSGGAIKLAPITVTAEQISEYVKNHPQNVVALNGKEIKDRNFLELGEAIDSMPGVEVRQRGGMGTKIFIRGGGSGPVLVLIDGRPVNSSQYGGVDLGSVPIETVKNIIVFKPPVPVWIGPGSSGGAVNIVTGSPKRVSTEMLKTKSRLKIDSGSYGAVNADCTCIAFQEKGSVTVTAGGGHIDGKRINSDRDRGNFSFNWNKKNKDQTKYDINGRYYYTNHGCSGPTDNTTPDARQRYQKGSLDFSMDGFWGEAGRFSMKSYLDIEDLKDRTQSGDVSTLDTLKAGMKGENTWSQEEGEWALRLGGLAEENTVNHTISGDHHREKVSVHAQHDREMDDFTGSLGLRGDLTNDFGLFPAINAGLSHSAGSNTLIKANIGYCVKIPSFNQLYQPSHGSVDQVRGNPDLSEEDVFSYNLGLEHKFSRDIFVNATLFRTDTRDLIAYQRGADLIYRPVNISQAYKQGVEVSLKYKWSGNVSVDVSYIYQDTKNKQTGGELTYAPRNSGKVTGKFVLPTRTRIEAIFKAKGSQYSTIDNNQSGRLDAYNTVDMKIIHPVLIKLFPCEIFVNIYNLFDSDFEFHAGYPDDGFRFMAGINLSF